MEDIILHSLIQYGIIVEQFVTGYWKTDHNVTLGQLHFIGPANSHTYALPICTVALTGLADWSAFLELVLPTM